MPSALAAALVLLSSAAVLVLEILVSRLAAPFVGLTLETYTAAIGVALAAIAAGAALGGRLADLAHPARWLGPALALGGGLLLLVRPTVSSLGPGVPAGPEGTVLLVAAAVGPAVLVLSTVPPGVVKLRLRTLAETGATVGRLSALGTLGALAGTFLTGFVLLSALPVSRVLLATGVLLLVVGVVLAVVLPRLAGTDAATAPTLAFLLVLGGLSSALLVVVDPPCERETRYYCASVLADRSQLRPTGRTLVLDGLRHSYVDLADPAYLEFDYTRRFGDVLASRPPGALDALHIGLGGGTIPRHLAAVRPGTRSTVLEVDPGVLALDRDRLGLVTGPDLTVRIGDARTSIAELPSAAYDVVVGDAFGSLAVPWHLTTREMVAQVRRVLRPGGVYLLNVIDNPPNAFARAEAATLTEAFDVVLRVGSTRQRDGLVGGNHVLVASDAPLPAQELAARSRARGGDDVVTDAAPFAAGQQVLTDDDAPVDQLLTPYVRP
ncbi:MAG TPA: fused MFS/spermidine synthase [Mycobacteriales bacterium]|nr:fused MFS/spermidine synthase [Mycobacteriales bacterium]